MNKYKIGDRISLQYPEESVGEIVKLDGIEPDSYLIKLLTFSSHLHDKDKSFYSESIEKGHVDTFWLSRSDFEIIGLVEDLIQDKEIIL